MEIREISVDDFRQEIVAPVPIYDLPVPTTAYETGSPKSTWRKFTAEGTAYRTDFSFAPRPDPLHDLGSINRGGKQVATNGLARQTGSPTTLRRKGCESQIEGGEAPVSSEAAESRKRFVGPFSREAGERSEPARREPQQAISHLFTCPVNKLESLKPNREDAKLALRYLNEAIPADLSLDDFLLLPTDRMEAAFYAILYRGNINLQLGNIADAIADEILHLSILDRLGQIPHPLETWDLAIYHLALGETEKGLSDLQQMAGKRGLPISYLLLKSLGHPLPAFTPSRSSTTEETDEIFDRIEQLFKEQRFEEAIAQCDEFLADRPFTLEPLVPISHLSDIDSDHTIEELHLFMRGSYFDILATRGLCKGILNDFSGAIQDYDPFISLLTAKPSYYRWGDSIVKVKFNYPQLDERILERGLLHYLHGDKDKALADLESLIPAFKSEESSFTSSAEEQNLLDYGYAHLGNAYAMLAAAMKKILFRPSTPRTNI